MQDGRGATDGWGIDLGYHATNGEWHETPDATRDAIRAAMGGPASEPRAPEGPPVWTVPAGRGGDLQRPLPPRYSRTGPSLGGSTACQPDLPLGYHHLVPVDGGPTTLLLVAPARCHRPPAMRRGAGGAALRRPLRARAGAWATSRDLRRLGRWARRHGAGISP